MNYAASAGSVALSAIVFAACSGRGGGGGLPQAADTASVTSNSDGTNGNSGGSPSGHGGSASSGGGTGTGGSTGSGSGGNMGGAAATVLFPVADPFAVSLPAPWTTTQGKVASHLGWDVSIPGDADVGEPVLAAYSGKVVIASSFPGWGGVTVLRCVALPNQPFRLPDGTTTAVVYVLVGHCAPLVQVGDLVTAGQPIATVEPLLPGVSSSGPHVHLEVLRGDAVDSGAASLPGPGYSSDVAVACSRVDPEQFFQLNGRPAKQEAKTVKVFPTPVMSVVIVDNDTAFVSERGLISGPLGGVWRLDYRTGAARKVADFFLAGFLTYDPTRDEVVLAVQGEGRVVAIELRNNETVRDLVTGLNQPSGVAVDHVNQRYVVSTNDHNLIAVPFAGGPFQTLAGNNSPGHSGDGGDPLQASLLFPGDLAVVNGVLYFADAGRHVRYIQNGVIDTLLGDVHPVGLDFSPAGRLWLALNRSQVVEDVDGVLYSRIGHPNQAGRRDGLLNEALLDQPRDVSVKSNAMLITADDRVVLVE